MGGPLTAMAVDDQVFWMGLSEFYVYNGAVQRLPCSVRDYVFEDMNLAQMEKVTAGLNTENGEIWWFYPSAASEENDRYVIYNYMEQAWYYGNLARTAWLDRGIEEFPIAASTDHYLYNHEFGFDDGSTSPSSAISSFITSSPIDLGDGEDFVFVRRLLPDVSFRNSSAPRAGDRHHHPCTELHRHRLLADHDQHRDDQHGADPPAPARSAVRGPSCVGRDRGGVALGQLALRPPTGW
jgi:hypothetical protein